MKRLFCVLFIFCLSFSNHIYAQQTLVHGIVADAETIHPLAYANISVLGTERGTMSNSNGIFQLQAEPAESLLVTYMGYRSDILPVLDMIDTTPANYYFPVFLTQTVLQSEGVTIYADENPAERLVKDVFQLVENHVNDFTYRQALYREIVSSDTTYLRIREIFYNTLTSPYGSRDWNMAQVREAKTPFPFSDNIIVVFYNFPMFAVEFPTIQNEKNSKGATFLTPLRENPAKYYTLSILGTRTENGRNITVVRATPKSKNNGRFLQGDISIDTNTGEVIEYSIYCDKTSKINKILQSPRGYKYENALLVFNTRFTGSVQNGDYGFDQRRADLSFNLISRKDKNFSRPEHFSAVLKFLTMDPPDGYDAAKTGEQVTYADLSKQVKNYDPGFWENKAHLIEEIPLEQDIQTFYQNHQYEGNLFPEE